MSSALTGLLPPILSTLTEKYPLMTLFVYPGSSNDLYAKIISGDLHAAVIIEPQFSMPKTSWQASPSSATTPSSGADGWARIACSKTT